MRRATPGGKRTSSTRSRVSARVGEPITALVTLALGESGEIYALYPSRDDPTLTAELAKQGHRLLACTDQCTGCAACN